ncbi:ribonuclease P protein component [Beijerinckiaceae bacterium]|nr:ribonuclease P protein component [Beijerinckiaceae bacterium]
MRKPRAKRGVQDLSAQSTERSEEARNAQHGCALGAPERLRRRADFLNAAKGKRFHARGLTLQVAPRRTSPVPTALQAGLPANSAASDISMMAPSGQGERLGDVPATPPRFGFTVTKKCGGAVQRNRIRRRLKEAVRLLQPLPGRPANDYVILARPEALGMSFLALQAEISRALGKIDTRKNLPPTRHDRDP